jgi:hypothetical protein
MTAIFGIDRKSGVFDNGLAATVGKTFLYILICRDLQANTMSKMEEKDQSGSKFIHHLEQSLQLRNTVFDGIMSLMQLHAGTQRMQSYTMMKMNFYTKHGSNVFYVWPSM